MNDFHNIIDPPEYYPLKCITCNREYIIKYHNADLYILRYCPICGDRALTWNDSTANIDGDHKVPNGRVKPFAI